MRKQNNIYAFTILESLITLMLISIIIALSYALISLIGKQLSLFEKENNQIMEYNLFNSTLINDINNSSGFELDNNNLILASYDKQRISYSIQKNYILRHQQQRIELDTFKILVVSNSFFISDGKNQSKDLLKLRLGVLNDTVTTNYYLQKNNADVINKTLFDEN